MSYLFGGVVVMPANAVAPARRATWSGGGA
jgi:hypothetical protein